MDFADNISDLYEVSLKLRAGAESNRQSQGYEPCVLPLDHPAKASVLAELIPLELRKLLIDSDYRR